MYKYSVKKKASSLKTVRNEVDKVYAYLRNFTKMNEVQQPVIL